MGKNLLDVCEKYYGTRDLYELFGVEKSAAEQDIKKSYYRLSLTTHPDRVPDADKKEATEKFKVLSKLYNVLCNKDSRALYDERGTIDDGDDASTNWMARWQQFFKPLTKEDIDNYKEAYVGSETERSDIKKTYLNGKGCKNYMMQTVPFMMCEDEPRIAEIVQKMIDDNEVPVYKIFTEEPAAKRNRRHKKYAREAQMAAEMSQQIDMKALEKEMAQRSSERLNAFTSMIETLEAKYCNNPDEEDHIVDFDDIIPTRTRARTAKNTAKATPSRRAKATPVKKTK